MQKRSKYQACNLFCFLMLSLISPARSYAAELDSAFLRNGEVYLSVQDLHVKEGGRERKTVDGGIYRLNDPEGALGKTTKYPAITNVNIENLNSYAVDINRHIYTMSTPKGHLLPQNSITLKRQVLNSSKALGPAPEEVGYQKMPKYRTDVVPTVTGVEKNYYVDYALADWGDWRYIHCDHRGGDDHYAGEMNRPDLYRACTTDSRYAIRDGGGQWKCFKIYQGTETDAPEDPVSYLPKFTNQNVILPYYPGKPWYDIPNGAWFSSWRARYDDSSNAAKRHGSPMKGFFYQCFQDTATVTQFDWELKKWNWADVASNESKQTYNLKSGEIVDNTTQESYKREVLAGCLDGCGGASGDAEILGGTVTLVSAFMPYDDNGKPNCEVYTYTRKDGTAKGKLKQSGSRANQPMGDKNRADTKWIGVSKGPSNGSDEIDYVYFLGTSQIQDWLQGVSDVDITAVAVSNQWNEEGGIIFAYDKNSKNIIRFTLKQKGTSLIADHTLIPIADLMGQFKAGKKVTIDDLATDGFGNLYISMTYPATDDSEDIPKLLKWTFNDAHSYDYKSKKDGSEYEITFKFTVDYGKSVWKVSNVGQPVEEIGQITVTSRDYIRKVTFDQQGFDALMLISAPNLEFNSNGLNELVEQYKKFEPGAFEIDYSDYKTKPFTIPSESSKLAVINAPTPPKMYSLGGDESYLDIIGAYESYPAPSPSSFSTNQNQPRIGPEVLDISKSYFFMVENYPLTNYVQDPNVMPDYDGDGRQGGFISSIINDGKIAVDLIDEGVHYFWQLWGTRDYNKNPYMAAGSNTPEAAKMNDGKDHFTMFYSPFPGKFILICSALVDFYDYSTVKFGQTIGSWKAQGKYKKRRWAIASGIGVDESTGLPIAASATARIDEILKKQFEGYEPPEDTDYPTYDEVLAKMPKGIIKDAANRIMNFGERKYTDPTYHIAVMALEAKGDAPAIDKTGDEDIVALQRHCFGDTDVGWATCSKDLNYFGIPSNKETYWRIATETEDPLFFQKMFLLDAKTQADGLYADPDNPESVKYYNYIASKLVDPTNKTYFANGDSNLVFEKNGKDIRWTNQEATLEAQIEYYTVLDAAGTIGTATLYLDDKDKKVSNAQTYDNYKGTKFKYYKVPEGALPPSDPFVAKLTIKMKRCFEYDAYIYKDGNLLMSNPIRIPKYLTIVGLAYIMVVDTEPPTLLFEKTAPNQLNTVAGAQLVSGADSIYKAGYTGPRRDEIRFSIKDNSVIESIVKDSSSHFSYTVTDPGSPLNGKTIKDHHPNWDPSNKEENDKILKAPISKTVNMKDLKPVFNIASRSFTIHYDVPQLPLNDTSALDKEVASDTKRFTPTYCTNMPNGSMPIELASISAIISGFNKSTTEMELKLPLADLASDGTNKGGALTIPITYANNALYYVPIEFYINGQDCSGNIMPETKMNLILESKDCTAPFPLGQIVEMKNTNDAAVNNAAKFPRCVSSKFAVTDDIRTFQGYTSKHWLDVSSYVLRYCGNTNDGVSKLLQPDGTNGLAATYNINKYGKVDIYGFPCFNKSAITSFTNSYSAIKSNMNSLPPGDIGIETGVEVFLSAGGVDNSGSIASVTMTYYNYDLNGTTQIKREHKSNAKFNEAKLNVRARDVFMPSYDSSVTMPYLVPMRISVTDDARDWDTYRWDGTSMVKDRLGADRNHTTEYITSFPVYGSALNIRRIETYIKKD